MVASPNREAIGDWSQKHKDKGEQQTGAKNTDAENVEEKNTRDTETNA